MGYEDALKIKKIVFTIILLAIFLYLVLFIVIRSYNLYQDNRQEAKTISEKSLDCSSLVFDVLSDTIKVEGDSVEFMIRNSIGEPFEHLVIDTGNRKYKFKLTNFVSGSDPLKIKFEDDMLEDALIAYPDGCPDNAKSVKLR